MTLRVCENYFLAAIFVHIISLISPLDIAMLPALREAYDLPTLLFFSFLMSPLSISFDNGWTDGNEDCCVNIADENINMARNLVNFGPVTPEILWRICMGGEPK